MAKAKSSPTRKRLCSTFMYDGKRIYVYGYTKKELKENVFKRREELENAAAQDVKSADLSIDDYFNKYWLEGKRGAVKETTIRANSMMYRNISAAKIGKSEKPFGTFKLSEIETKDVKDLQTILRSRLSTRTVNDTISMLSGILETALNERIIEWNPARAVRALKRTEPRATETIHRALTMDETAKFLQAAADTRSWYTNLYTFLLHTGARIGEAGSITPSDVSRDNVHIHRTITRTEIGGYKIGTDTKTAAGDRYIPLDDEAMKAIAAQRRIEHFLRGRDGKVTDISEMSEPVFRTPHGALLRSALVNTDIARICKRAGIDVFTVHAFRDTFATRCVESGMDVKQLQSIMGHTNIAMTLGLYAHANDELKQKQLKAVNFT